MSEAEQLPRLAPDTPVSRAVLDPWIDEFAELGGGTLAEFIEWLGLNTAGAAPRRRERRANMRRRALERWELAAAG